VRNTGSKPIAAPFWIEFLARPVDPPAATPAYLCDSLRIANPLDAGETVILSWYPRATYALAPGIYTVGVRLDPLNEIAEQREDDNLVWIEHRPLYVGITPTAARGWIGYR
jgi:hypothetical protein